MPADFYTYLNNKEDLKKVWTRTLELELDDEVDEKTLLDYMKTIKEYQINSEITKLMKVLKEESSVEKQTQIILKIRDLKNNL